MLLFSLTFAEWLHPNPVSVDIARAHSGPSHQGVALVALVGRLGAEPVAVTQQDASTRGREEALAQHSCNNNNSSNNVAATLAIATMVQQQFDNNSQQLK